MPITINRTMHKRAGTCTHTRRCRQRKSSAGRTNTSWGVVVVGAETPHGWSQVTTRTGQPAGPHTNGSDGENPLANRRDCNVAICKSRNLVIISTEVRSVPPFHKVPHSRCIGPLESGPHRRVRQDRNFDAHRRLQRKRSQFDLAHWAGPIGFRWRKHKGGRCRLAHLRRRASSVM